jgi:uncharacterized repeat protein (TIGR01451 family)
VAFHRYLGAVAVLLCSAPLPVSVRTGQHVQLVHVGLYTQPAAFTLRYSAQGWGDLTQAGAAAVACPTEGPTCQDGTDASIPTAWVDVDADPSTVDSSRAVLAIPPRAAVDWVGLYWAGDRGTRTSGQPACDAAAQAAQAAVPPPSPDRANQVKLAVGDRPYTQVTAGAVTSVTGPGGGIGYQAYADITAVLRPVASGQITLTVADIQVAQGPGCVGGWTVMLAYSYPDGPDHTYAPNYRSVTVFDGVAATPVGSPIDVRLDGLVTPTEGPVEPRLSLSILASGQALGAGGVSLGGTPVARAGPGTIGTPGPGYQLATVPVATTAIGRGTTGTALTLSPVRGGFVAAAVGLSTPLPIKVDLSVHASLHPSTVAVGSETTLTVTVRNDAEVTAYGVAITARLPAGLTLVNDVPSYEPGTGRWHTGKVLALGSTSLSLSLRAEAAGTYTSTAEVTATDVPDTDTQDDVASVTLIAVAAPPSEAVDPRGPVAAATEGTWLTPAVLFGTGLFLLGVFLCSVVVIRSRSSRS